jgi:membrane protein implicated in regulation of membrane protease activity
MLLWQMCLCVGLVLLIAELFMPFTFFLSMAIGAFLTAIVSIWVVTHTTLIVVFAILSLVSLLIFKPFLAKYQKNLKNQQTGIEGQYIGKKAKVLKHIDKNSGAISIYGERWEARPINENECFEEETEVEIVKNESLTMYVKSVN